MIKKTINQNDILNIELLNTLNYNYIFNKAPINRYKIKQNLKTLADNLKNLKNKINTIQNCELRKNAHQIVFEDGRIDSKIMLIGDSPGNLDEEKGKPFMGQEGALLEKMLFAINIKKINIYLTNVFKFKLLKERKPTLLEIKRYANFLKEQISIINPKILILMGSTAMQAIFNESEKISLERGQWKKLKLNENEINVIITFHPAYLIQKPDQKKLSWIDLKLIKNKIFDLNLNL